MAITSLALALSRTLQEKIKCTAIDPPYNTGNAFEHYDRVEHSIWLSLMDPRIEILHSLLRPDGTLWIAIDDDESHYLKVLCDGFLEEKFCSKCNMAEKIFPTKMMPNSCERYARSCFIVCKKQKSLHPNWHCEWWENKKKDTDWWWGTQRFLWISIDYTCNKNKNERPNLYYPIINSNTGEEIWPKETTVWRFSKETFGKTKK